MKVRTTIYPFGIETVSEERELTIEQLANSIQAYVDMHKDGAHIDIEIHIIK